MDTVTKSAESSDRRRQVSFKRWNISRLLHIKYSLGAPLLGSVSGSPSQAVWTSTHIKNTKEVITCMSAMSKKEISAVWLLTFCSHFPSAHLVSIWLEVIISYISQHSTRQPLEKLCILYMWAEAAITIEIVRARELNFSTQEKKWVTLPLITHWALWRVVVGEMGISAFSLLYLDMYCWRAWWRANKYHNYTWFLKDVKGGGKWFVSISTKITK